MRRVRPHLFLLLGLLLARRPALALLPTDELSQFGRLGWQTGNGLPQNTVTAIAQTKDGFLWVGTEGGLARFDGYGFYPVPELQNQAIRDLWTTGDGLLVVAIANHVLELKNGSFLPSRREPVKTEQAALPNLTVQPTKVLLDSHRLLWVGTNHGLFRWRAGKLEPFGPGDPLATAEILVLFEDSQGDIWAGTGDSGLQLIKQSRFTTYTTDRIRCVFADDSTAWFGTDGNGLLRLQGNTVVQEHGLSSDVVLSLATTRGHLLAGTPDGLDILGPRRSTLTSADGLPDDFVRSLFVDRDGSIWAGTRRGLAHIEGAAITTYTQSNGLGSDLVGAIARDQAGNLWVATLHGLSRWNNGSFANYTIADGLSSNIVTDLFAGSDGYLWIATQGGGLNRFRDEMFRHTGPLQGLPGTLYGVTGDANGNLWLTAATGLYRLRKQDFDRPHSAASFGAGDGLRIAESGGGGHPGIWKNPDGGIWFATARGAAYLSPEHAALQDPTPNVVIESVNLDDAALSPYAAAEIQPGHPRIALQYAGIDFANPQRVRYRYQLTGFDTGWIDAGARRTAYYTNLSPGPYTFRVWAGNSEGRWSSQSATFSFRVLPYFYQTWWFRLLLICCSAALVSALVRWRIQRVQSEFRAVLNERTRIAREIHDTLAQGFAGISVQLELVSRLLASPDKARHPLDQARLLARTCLDDARRTIWDLRSQNTGVEDLPARLSKLVRDASQSSGIGVQFQVRGAYRPLEQRVENEIARIAQEAIANALRHSHARVIDTNLVFEDNTVRLTVSDDGCGMKSVESADGHYGLLGMRERAANIGAGLSIRSREGEGTTVQLEAPIR